MRKQVRVFTHKHDGLSNSVQMMGFHVSTDFGISPFTGDVEIVTWITMSTKSPIAATMVLELHPEFVLAGVDEWDEKVYRLSARFDTADLVRELHQQARISHFGTLKSFLYKVRKTMNEGEKESRAHLKSEKKIAEIMFKRWEVQQLKNKKLKDELERAQFARKIDKLLSSKPQLLLPEHKTANVTGSFLIEDEYEDETIGWDEDTWNSVLDC